MIRALHILSNTERRGAQIFAADLIRACENEVDQSVVALRRSKGPSITFAVRTYFLTSDAEDRPRRIPRTSAVHRLSRLIGRLTPDVIVVHGGEALKYVIPAWPSAPILYRRIGQAPTHLLHGLRRHVYSLLIRRADLVIAVAQCVRDETIRSLGADPRRVMVIPNGVDPSRIQPVDRRDARQRLGVAPDAFVILSMGALVPEKEPMAHVRVGSAALQSLPNAVHLIAGDGSLFADLEHAIQRSGQAGRMLMLGSRDDVPALLAASDVVLFLSRSSGMEGMPAVAIEAGMSGRSFVGYDVAGVSEVVLNETTGLLVRESDESSVVEALVRLSQDDALRARLGGAARTRCLGSFDIAAVADRYANAYRMAMDARHAA